MNCEYKALSEKSWEDHHKELIAGGWREFVRARWWGLGPRDSCYIQVLKRVSKRDEPRKWTRAELRAFLWAEHVQG